MTTVEIPFTVDGSDHDIGSVDCCPLWGEMKNHREADGEDCDGLIHNQYVDEGWDYVQYAHRCDRCGERVFL